MHISTRPSGASMGRRMWHALVAGLAVYGGAAGARPGHLRASGERGLAARRLLEGLAGAHHEVTVAEALGDVDAMAQSGGSTAYQGEPGVQLPQPAALLRQRAAYRWQKVGAAADDLSCLLRDLLPELEAHFGPRVREAGDRLSGVAARARAQATRASNIIRSFPPRPADDLSRRLAGLAGTSLHELRQVLSHVGWLTVYQDSYNHSRLPQKSRPHIAQRVDVLMRLLHGP